MGGCHTARALSKKQAAKLIRSGKVGRGQLRALQASPRKDIAPSTQPKGETEEEEEEEEEEVEMVTASHPPTQQERYLTLKAEEAAQVPPRKKFVFKKVGKQIVGLNSRVQTLKDPAVKKSCLEYWFSYAKIQERQIQLISLQWDKHLAQIRANAEVMDPDLKKSDKAPKGKKSPPPTKKGAPVKVSYDIRHKIKFQELYKVLRIRKTEFKDSILSWRTEINKYARFKEAAAKRGKFITSVPPPRPIFTPLCSFTMMFKAVGTGIAAETAMRALGDFGENDPPLTELGMVASVDLRVLT
jgi:hypothetical protein